MIRKPYNNKIDKSRKKWNCVGIGRALRKVYIQREKEEKEKRTGGNARDINRFPEN